MLVRVDGLPEERDLGDPLLDDGADLGDDPLGLAVLLRAAHVRHDAVGAAVIAPALDRDPRVDLRFAPDLETLVVLVRREVEDREPAIFRHAAYPTEDRQLPPRLAVICLCLCLCLC